MASPQELKIPYHSFPWLYMNFEQDFDDGPATLWWQQKWHYSIYFCVVYVLVIFGLKMIMRSFKPFHLRVPLVLWNSCLAVFSTWGAVRMVPEMVHKVVSNGFHNSVCVTSGWSDFALTGIAFVASKPVELGDTLFVVLRKKPLIFLHWYHHVTVLLYVWHASNGLWPTNQWYTTMNYTVHSMMYTYYAIRAVGWSCPKFVAMFITIMQLLQMFAGCFIAGAVVYYKYIGEYCVQTDLSITLCSLMYFSYLLLFAHFFKNAYCTTKHKKPQPTKEYDYAITREKKE